MGVDDGYADEFISSYEVFVAVHSNLEAAFHQLME